MSKPKRDQTQLLLAAESKMPAWLVRYANTIIITLMWPCILLGFISLAAFLILNSSYGPKILHSQLSGFLRGDYWADTMSTDAFLQTLTMTNVRLSEAGDDVGHFVFAPKVEAKIPIIELKDLISDFTLTVGRIKAYDADVYIDFRGGELNLLKIVLPYFSKPDPPSPPGEFVTHLADLNVTNTDVHLIFDGFHIELYHCEVDHYNIRIAGELEMNTPLAKENGDKPAIRVANGDVIFNPALFSFALSSVGDKDEGLIFSGGPGSAGKVGYAYGQMVRHIEDILRQNSDYAEKVGLKPDMRGEFVVPLRNTLVDGFDWLGNTFKIPHMTSDIGDGGNMVMDNAMMNVGPTQDDIDIHSQDHHHTVSGLLPQESLLWAADLDLNLKVSDPILTYFFGPILIGDDLLRLQASMAGDLARVSGDIALDMPEFEVFDVDVERAALRANMDGQHLTISAFEADTSLGGVLVGGFYDIMDGNFDLDLWAGMAPKDPDFPYVDPEFRERIQKGLTPLDYMPDGDIQRFSGLFSSHLKAQSQDGVITVSLPEPLNYTLDEPLYTLKTASITSSDPNDNRILQYQNGVMTSPGGLNVDLGTDYVRIAPGLHLDTNNLLDISADISAHVEKPSVYTKSLGIEGVEADPVDLSVGYYACGNDLCGGLKLKSANISYQGIRIPNVDVALDLDHSKIRTKNFKINSDLTNITANIQGELTHDKLASPTSIPFHAEMDFANIDMDTIVSKLEPFGLESLKTLGLEGKGRARLIADGPIDTMKARFFLTMENLKAMEVDASRLSMVARYEDNKVLVPAMNLWFGPSELHPEEVQQTQKTSSPESQEQSEKKPELIAKAVENEEKSRTAFGIQSSGPRVPRRTPDFSLGALTYDLEKNTIEFNVALQPVSPNDFKPFRDLELPVEGQISFDVSAHADLNAFMGDGNRKQKVLESTWAEGEINLKDVKYDQYNLGNTQILMSRSAQYTLIKGNIVDTFRLAGFVRTAPNFTVSVSLDFPDLDVLNTLDRVGIDLSGLKDSFSITEAMVSGSLGFCMKSFDDMKVSMLLDDLVVDALGNKLELTQPSFTRVDLNAQSVRISQLELKYRDSVLKMSGNADATGKIDFDLNGEVDAAIAGSFVKSVQDSSGLLGISLSAKGNFYNHGKFSVKNIGLKGYLGVRDPIQVLTAYAKSPLELKQGFLVIGDHSDKCSKNELCLYTPDDKPFMLGMDDQWVSLSLFASSSGKVNVLLDGALKAAMAKMFVKDITEASGSLALNASVAGNILDKNGALDIDFRKMEVGGYVAVAEPISVEMHYFNEPITLDKGIVKLAEGSECSNGKQCITIPKAQAFQGNLMGGNYIIFGEVLHDALDMKSGNLSITGNNVGFRMKDELSLTLSPDIKIVVRDFNDPDTYKVSGDIDIAEAKYKKNFDDGSNNFIREQILSLFIDSKKRVEAYSPSFLRKMPWVGKVNLDVGVTAENSISADVRIATATVELEVGTQLRIGGTVKEFAPSGIVSINQGVFSLRGNDFEFQNGAQVAFNGSLDGKIDVTATTEISTDSSAFSAVTGNTDLDKRKRISTSSSTSSDLYSITLTVGGTVYRPVWSFESSPYLTDTNVYALILTGKTIDDFSGNDVAMESLLSPIFSSQLDTFINADQFKFVFSEGAAQFVYVKQINKGLRVAAGVSIRGSEGNEQALSAEYYFNDNWFVDLTGQNTSDEDGHAPTFKLGARLHWHLPLD